MKTQQELDAEFWFNKMSWKNRLILMVGIPSILAIIMAIIIHHQSAEERELSDALSEQSMVKYMKSLEIKGLKQAIKMNDMDREISENEINRLDSEMNSNYPATVIRATARWQDEKKTLEKLEKERENLDAEFKQINAEIKKANDKVAALERKRKQ